MTDPTTPVAQATKSTYLSIPIDKIKPSRHQARKRFDEESIKDLAKSMKEEGLIQPISVRPMGDGWELVAGERRLRAAKSLGWQTIDAKVVLPVSEGEAAAKGLIENLQREDLNPMEEAEGFHELNQIDSKYWTQERISSVCGKGKTYVSESMGLLALPEQVKQKVRTCELSRSHAELLSRLPTPESQQAMGEAIVKNGWNVREAEHQITLELQKLGTSGTKKGKKKLGRPSKDPFASLWEDLKKDPLFRSDNVWDVSFIKGKWNFTVDPLAFQRQEFLGKWFQALGNLIEKLAGEEKIESIDPHTEGEDGIDPSLKSALRSMKDAAAYTPERLNHLLAIGEKGPGPILQELLPEDPATEALENKTWDELGMPGGAPGLAQMLLIVDQQKEK